MAANALSLFEPTSVPDHVKAFLEGHSNIPPSDRVPTLSIKGRVFTINLDGESTKIMRVNAEGEEEPVNILPVVVLASSEKRGREFYEGDYNPEATAPPVCWSNDSEKPDASIKEPKASSCNKCPLSAKGSKVDSSGREMVACRQFRTIAVVPAHDLTFEPLRMKLPITSDFDGRSKDAQAKGWYGFKNYIDLLRSKGYKDTRALSTRLRFDPSSEWVKVQFSPGKWLSPEALAKAAELSELPNIKELLTIEYTQRAVEEPSGPPAEELEEEVPSNLKAPSPKNVAKAPVEVADEDDEEVVAPVKKPEAKPPVSVAAAPKTNGVAKPKVEAKAPVAPVEEDDEDAIIAQAMAKKAEKAAQKAAAEAAAKAAPKATATVKAKAPVAPVEEDDDAPAPKAEAKAAKPTAAPASTKPVAVSPAVANVLGAWAGEDDE